MKKKRKKNVLVTKQKNPSTTTVNLSNLNIVKLPNYKWSNNFVDLQNKKRSTLVYKLATNVG